jgi:hypothetical protein
MSVKDRKYVRIVDMHAMGRALFKAIWKNVSPHYRDGELQKIALGNSWGSPRLQAGVNLLLPDMAMIHPHRSTPPEMQRGPSIMRLTFWILVAFSLLFVNSKRPILKGALTKNTLKEEVKRQKARIYWVLPKSHGAVLHRQNG